MRVLLLGQLRGNIGYGKVRPDDVLHREGKEGEATRGFDLTINLHEHGPLAAARYTPH